MRSVNGRTGNTRTWPRLLMMATSGIWLCGCAAMTTDVDAYYRQMAVNYQEAIERSKLEESTLEKQAQVLAATGDRSKSRKARREARPSPSLGKALAANSNDSRRPPNGWNRISI